MKKRLLQILMLLAAAAVIVGGWYGYQLATQKPEFTFRTAKVDRGNIVARVSATGTLSAHVTVQVGSQVSGRIEKINVDFNSPVKKGEVIAKIDPALFEASVASARANTFAAEGALAQARAQAVLADRQLARAKMLHAEQLNSQADLDTADTALVVARAQIEAAKGNLAQAQAQQHQSEINLAYTTIVSPTDGIVISRNIDVGQTVAASLAAPTLFTIAEDLRKMQVDTNVTEGDVGKLKAGMTATFLVDAYPNERFKGTILQIRNAATTVQNVVTYDAVIDVENTDLKLRPGMTANATVANDRRDDVLRVPNAALRFRAPPSLAGSARPSSSAAPDGSGAAPGGTASAHHRHWDGGAPDGSAHPHRHPDGGRPEGGRSEGGRADGDLANDRRTVWVLRSDKPGERPVQVSVRTGLSDGTLTEIVSGDLQEGDVLVVEAVSNDDAPAGTAKPAAGGGAPRMRL